MPAHHIYFKDILLIKPTLSRTAILFRQGESSVERLRPLPRPAGVRGGLPRRGRGRRRRDRRRRRRKFSQTGTGFTFNFLLAAKVENELIIILAINLIAGLTVAQISGGYTIFSN